MTPARIPTIFHLSRAAEGEGGWEAAVIRDGNKHASSPQSARLGGERPSCGGGGLITKTCGNIPASLSPKPDGGLLATGSEATCSQNSTWMNWEEREDHLSSHVRCSRSSWTRTQPFKPPRLVDTPVLNIPPSNHTER